MGDQVNEVISIERKEMPSLYQSASKESGKAQKGYLWLVRLYIFTLIIGSALLSFSTNHEKAKTTINVIGSIFLLISTFLMLLIALRRRERDWYGSRFIAESVKTLAWRYMMCAKPFEVNLEDKELDNKFIDKLSEILRGREILSWDEGTLGEGSQISDKMRDVRKQNANERLRIYKEQRIDDQKGWYSRKSRGCKKMQNIWFMAIIILHILVLMLPCLILAWKECPVSLTSVVAVIVSSIFSWIQVKRYQELAQSYGVAANELAMISERARYIGDDDAELSKFVTDSEDAISREHTLWIAKRDRIYFDDRKQAP